MTKNFHPPDSRRGEARRGYGEKTRGSRQSPGPGSREKDGGWKPKLDIGRLIMH